MKWLSICTRATLAIFAVACMASAVRAQRVITVPGNREEYEAWRVERESELMRRQMARENERFKRESEWRRNNANRPNSAGVLPPTRKMTAEHKRRLYPTEAERASLSALLREDGTGLMRLLPYTRCTIDPRIVNVEQLPCLEQVPPVAGGGSFYSFRNKKHHTATQADIALRDNAFNVGFMRYTLGLLTTLGDVPLESVSLETEAVRPFLKFVPARTQEETEREFLRSRAWLKSPAYVYGPAAAVRENTTYVLRSISFGPNRTRPADVLVAFRVTRKDPDGAVTIAWKQLQKPKS
ncbi:MAG TPA: hypothetical protein VF656_03000 [Pyrinomonadaceae bacterium]|jgi:hypothetical protein